MLDQAMIALLADLQSKGLLDQTLVVLGTEFGCTSRINDNDGQEHHAFRCLLAGAGIREGKCMGDTHSDNFEGTPHETAVLDQAVIALLADLQSKGLLDQMLVVMGTEFGRTPRISDNDGRDHWNKALMCLLAGVGINMLCVDRSSTRHGQVYGKMGGDGPTLSASKAMGPPR